MRKPTIIQFIGIRAVILLTLILIGMSVLFVITIDRAQYDAARWTVESVASHAARRVMRQDDGRLMIDPVFLEEIQYCHLLVLDEDGKVISGDIPEGLEGTAEDVPEHNKFKLLYIKGKKIYTYDHAVRMIRDESGSHVTQYGRPDNEGDPPAGCYVRAVLRADDLKTVYDDIGMIFFVFVFALLFISVIWSMWLHRKAALPVSEVCNNIKKLSEDPVHTDHVEKAHLFYETEVMTDAYNKLIDRTEKLKHQQDEFNENVAHELRTPVAVIRSEVELLQDLYGESLSEEAVESLKVIHKQTGRINAMLAELNYMAKMERENFALNKEAIDLSDIAESVCEDIEDTMPGKTDFRYHWEPSEAEVDVTLIMIAVRNVVSNAVKYCPEKSPIDLYSGTGGGNAFLKIQDHGPGIAEKDLEKIFDPYFQVKSERNSEGFGLGLALTMKIAKKHGGTVLAESEVGKGSTFTIVLPVK